MSQLSYCGLCVSKLLCVVCVQVKLLCVVYVQIKLLCVVCPKQITPEAALTDMPSASK
jgi:hypothetical protein